MPPAEGPLRATPPCPRAPAARGYVSCGLAQLPPYGTAGPATTTAAAGGLLPCCCHLLRRASGRSWLGLASGSGVRPLSARAGRRELEGVRRDAIPQRQVDYSTLSLEQSGGAAGGSLLRASTSQPGASIRLGSAPAVLFPTAAAGLVDTSSIGAAAVDDCLNGDAGGAGSGALGFSPSVNATQPTQERATQRRRRQQQQQSPQQQHQQQQTNGWLHGGMEASSASPPLVPTVEVVGASSSLSALLLLGRRHQPQPHLTATQDESLSAGAESSAGVSAARRGDKPASAPAPSSNSPAGALSHPQGWGMQSEEQHLLQRGHTVIGVLRASSSGLNGSSSSSLAHAQLGSAGGPAAAAAASAVTRTRGSAGSAQSRAAAAATLAAGLTRARRCGGDRRGAVAASGPSTATPAPSSAVSLLEPPHRPAGSDCGSSTEAGSLWPQDHTTASDTGAAAGPRPTSATSEPMSQQSEGAAALRGTASDPRLHAASSSQSQLNRDRTHQETAMNRSRAQAPGSSNSGSGDSSGGNGGDGDYGSRGRTTSTAAHRNSQHPRQSSPGSSPASLGSAASGSADGGGGQPWRQREQEPQEHRKHHRRLGRQRSRSTSGSPDRAAHPHPSTPTRRAPARPLDPASAAHPSAQATPRGSSEPAAPQAAWDTDRGGQTGGGGEPSTSYDASYGIDYDGDRLDVSRLMGRPLDGCRRRRRLVPLFPVARPHRWKRQALDRGARLAAAAEEAAEAAAAAGAEQRGGGGGGGSNRRRRGAPFGGEVETEGGGRGQGRMPEGAGGGAQAPRQQASVSMPGVLQAAANEAAGAVLPAAAGSGPGARAFGGGRNRERFNFPFTVSRTSGTPIRMRSQPRPPPEPAGDTAGAVPNGILDSASVAAVVLPPAPASATEAAEVGVTRSPMGSKDAAWTGWDELPASDTGGGAAEKESASAAAGRLAAATLSAAPFVLPIRPAVHPYSLTAAPPYVLYAVVAPEHRYLVYRFGAEGRWHWRPMLRVTGTGGSGMPPLVAVALSGAAAVAAAAMSGHTQPQQHLCSDACGGQDRPSAPGAVAAETRECDEAGPRSLDAAAPLQFYLTPQLPPAAAPCPLMAGPAARNAAAAATAAASATAAAAAAAATARSARAQAGVGGHGKGGGKGGSRGGDSAAELTASQRPTAGASSVAGRGGGLQSTAVPAVAAAVPLAPPLQLSQPGHYLVSFAAPFRRRRQSGFAGSGEAPTAAPASSLAASQQLTAEEQPRQQQQQQQSLPAVQPAAQPILQQEVALVVDASSLTGRRGREWDTASLALRRVWEASQRVRPGLLILATSRMMRSLEQTWRDKQAFLPQPDILLLGLGTVVAYRVPHDPTAAAAVPDAAADAPSAAGGWQEDEGWVGMLDASYDATAVRRAVDAVVRQYDGVRVAPQQQPRRVVLPAADAAASGGVASVGGDGAGQPAVSFGLSKQQGRHKVCLQVHRSLVDTVVRQVEDRLRASAAAASAAAATAARRGRGPHKRLPPKSSLSPPPSLPSPPLQPSAAAAAAGRGGPGSVQFVVQPRGREWVTLDVIPSAAGKAAALLHVLRRFSIDPSSVVAAGDTDRDAELLAAVGCAMVTTPRPPPALWDLLVRRNLQPAASAGVGQSPSGSGGAGGAGGGCQVVQSASAGAAGVLEGLQLLGLL